MAKLISYFIHQTSFIRRNWPLGLAIAVGLFARVWALGTHSLLLDEASVSLGARDILLHHTPIWDANSNAPFVWLAAHLIGLTGLNHPFFIRLPAALFGTACIALIYWLALRLFSKTIAVFSAALFAIHPFAIAFNRVLFADAFQLFFILAGCIAFEYYCEDRPDKGGRLPLLLIVLFWGAAFLMKYNAVVPGMLWLVAGVIARRYSIPRAIIAFAAMSLGAFVTLLPWPYDAPVWLFAFLGKGGSYNIVDAAQFFWEKLHLILFGITEITLLLGVACLFIPIRGRRPIFQTTAFLLLYVIIISILGRTFERYLLTVVPFASMLLVAIVISAFRWSAPKTLRSIIPLVLAGMLAWFGYGMYHSFSYYVSYLGNDCNRTSVANETLALEQNGTRRAFWLLPEPIGGYYLGFSQFYSRNIQPQPDGTLAERNYFEWESVPFCEHREGLGIFAVRRMARRWGVWRILASPLRFRDSVQRLRARMNAIFPPPGIDYFTSPAVHHGDLLIMQSGITELQQEPILEDISEKNGPPYFKHLPLNRFRTLEVFRPDGLSNPNDTTITRVEAGVWLMEKR